MQFLLVCLATVLALPQSTQESPPCYNMQCCRNIYPLCISAIDKSGEIIYVPYERPPWDDTDLYNR